MKLIKMTYDRSSASVRQCLVDRQDMHRNIQSFFGTTRESANVLYRVTKDGIYVSSTVDPIVAESNGITIVASKEISLRNDGDVLRFNVFTRPYKKNKGHRIPLIREQERLEWLYKQSKQHGFEIISVSETGHGTVKSISKGFEIEGYYYAGTLMVTDKEKFSSVLKKGIGAEKAYGLGLMLVV